MSVKISEETSVSSSELTHNIDVLICELKEVKARVNNSSNREKNSFDFDITKHDMKNLMAITNVVKVKIKSL